MVLTLFPIRRDLTKFSTTLTCDSLSSSLSGPIHITSTPRSFSSCSALTAPAWIDFQKMCVVPLGITAIRYLSLLLPFRSQPVAIITTAIAASTIALKAFFIILTPRVFILAAPVSLARLVREAAALRKSAWGRLTAGTPYGGVHRTTTRPTID